MWKRARDKYQPEPSTAERNFRLVKWNGRLLLIQIAVSVAMAIYASIFLRGIRDADIPSYLRMYESYVSVIVPHIGIHAAALAGSIYESQIPFFQLTTSLIWGFNIIPGLIQLCLIPSFMSDYKEKMEVRNKGNITVFPTTLAIHILIIIYGISVWDGVVAIGPLGIHSGSPAAIISMTNLVSIAFAASGLLNSVSNTIALLFYKFKAKAKHG